MYNDTLNGSTEKRSSELPDAVGPIVQLQEKLYVPVKEYPDVSISLSAYLHLYLYVTATSYSGYNQEKLNTYTYACITFWDIVKQSNIFFILLHALCILNRKNCERLHLEYIFTQ